MYAAAQIVSIPRQIKVAVATGQTNPVACRKGGIPEQTCCRCRKRSDRPHGRPPVWREFGLWDESDVTDL